MVPVNTAQTGQLVILNTGGSELDITEIASDNAAFTVDVDAVVVQPGESQIVTVTFTPTQMQLYSDSTLTISYGDGDEYTLALSGTGTVSTSKPDIATLDAQSAALTGLTFSDTIVDGESSMTFLITNTGASDLSVTSATLSGDDADAFTIVQTNLENKSSDNYTISAGGQRAIKILFSPTASGAHEATLTLASNDPDESVVTIPLSGTAVQPNLVVDLTPNDDTVSNALNPLIAFGQQVADGLGGERGMFPINIVNTGTTALTISSIGFGLEGSAFSIEGDGIELEGFTVEAGESIAAFLIFDPMASQGSISDLGPAADTTELTDTLTITSDDLDTPVMRFSLSGEAVDAYVETSVTDEGISFTYIDPDGDVVLVEYANEGVAEFSFDGESLESVNLSGIEITDAIASTKLTITDTNEEGDGVIEIGTILIHSDFGILNVAGDVDEITIEGAANKILIGGTLGGLDVEGAVSTLEAGGLTGDIGAASFGKIDVEGDVDDAEVTADDAEAAEIRQLTVSGTVNDLEVTAESFGKATFEGAVSGLTLNTDNADIKKLTFKADADEVTVSARSLKSLKGAGNVLDSSLSLLGEGASLGSVKVTGDSGLDVTVDGAIKKIAVNGNLDGQIAANTATGTIGSITSKGNITADISAQSQIKSIKAAGSFLADELRLDDAGSLGQLKKLTVGGELDITNLSVQGDIGKMKIGSKKNGADLSGTINADGTIKSIKVYGDIHDEITAVTKLGKVTASGSLYGDLDSQTEDIDRVLIGETIYGTITVNDGQGIIGRIDYTDNTFRNETTDMVELPRQHINATWS
jgi:hypothetical protein